MWRSASTFFAMTTLLIGAAGGVQAASSRAIDHWDMITLEINSWGRPVTSWRLLADGSGSWTETVPRKGSPQGEYDLVWHEFAAGENGYREVVRILSRLPDPAPDYDHCANSMTDQPYGKIRLTRGATTTEIAWNSGCTDDDYRAFMDTLKAADSLVAGWGRTAKILRREAVLTSP